MSLAESLAHRLCLDLVERLDGALAFAERLDRMRLSPEVAASVQALAAMVRDSRDVVGGVIDLRHAASGRLDLKAEPLRLLDAVDQVAEQWTDRAMAAGLSLVAAYDGHPDLAVVLDGQRLVQAIGCLVGHAISRGGGGGLEVALTARTEDDAAILDVSVRDGSRAAQGDCTVGGELGLALGRELITALGGETLRSEDNAGAGVTWSFRLRAPVARAAEIERSARASALGHVLIVDDNATNRMVAEALCEGFDCTSETACDGLEAVEAVRRGRFDAVLMDIKMPNLDGLGATAAIRALPGPASATPILAMTANADPADIARYLAAGMKGVVEKPIKPEQLAAALNSVLFGDQPAVEDVATEVLEA